MFVFVKVMIYNKKNDCVIIQFRMCLLILKSKVCNYSFSILNIKMYGYVEFVIFFLGYIKFI